MKSMPEIDRLQLPAAEGACLALCHDLRSPIATAAAAVQELDRSGALEDTASRYVEIARASLSKADELLATLPDLLSSNAVELRPVDLRDVIRAAQEDVRIDLQLCNARVRLLGTPPEVLGEPERLRIALRNLFQNSIRYRRDDVHLEICVRSWLRGRTAILTIADNGLGLHGRGSRRPGLGLGLSIARRALETSGGRLRLSPRRGPGTIAAVTLRVGPSEPGPATRCRGAEANQRESDSTLPASLAASSAPLPRSERSRGPARSSSSARPARAAARGRALRSP